MDRATFERQQVFAAGKKVSMQRRCVGHDYTAPCMYMITMTTEGRRPLLGTVLGRSDAPPGSDDEPRLEPSPLGQAVMEEWNRLTIHYPQLRPIRLQLMPDHLHGILWVKEKLPCHLSRVVAGFKTGCNRRYRQLLGEAPEGRQEGAPVPYVATQSQQTGPAGAAGTPSSAPSAPSPSSAPSAPLGPSPSSPPSAPLGPSSPPPASSPSGVPAAWRAPQRTRDSHPSHGLLFAVGFNDKILQQEGQLKRWKDYLRDNPRRLLMRREHPEFLRVRRNVVAAGMSFSAIGNTGLLDHPELVQVQLSRSLSPTEIEERKAFFLSKAENGAVLVSPKISEAEKAVLNAAFAARRPLIVIQENGFTDLDKPKGALLMEACAEGRLLLLAPWEHHNERIRISRQQCLLLNEMARRLCDVTVKGL